MPGIALDETVGCTNPLLQFFYQENGVLTNVYELSFQVQDLKNNAEKVASTAVNLDLCADGGARLSTGRYAASFSAPSTGTSKWYSGTHEITWTYKATATSDEKTWKQRFEILNSSVFPTGRGYRGYVDSMKLLENSALYNCEVEDVQEAAQMVAEAIEDYTGRFFDPRYIDARYNATNAGALPLGHPIIGISEVQLLSGNDVYLDIDLDGLVVYNRHLTQGLMDPDDRDNPRLEFVSSELYDITIRSVQSHFVLGRQNTRIAGVFGYTEYDGTPIGTRPRRLERAAGIMTLRQIQDPFGVDVFTSQPGRIRSAKTRDQSVSFATARDGGVGSITGDRIVDDILLAYLRPPYYGAVEEGFRSREYRDNNDY